MNKLYLPSFRCRAASLAAALFLSGLNPSHAGNVNAPSEVAPGQGSWSAFIPSPAAQPLLNSLGFQSLNPAEGTALAGVLEGMHLTVSDVNAAGDLPAQVSLVHRKADPYAAQVAAAQGATPNSLASGAAENKNPEYFAVLARLAPGHAAQLQAARQLAERRIQEARQAWSKQEGEGVPTAGAQAWSAKMPALLPASKPRTGGDSVLGPYQATPTPAVPALSETEQRANWPLPAAAHHAAPLVQGAPPARVFSAAGWAGRLANFIRTELFSRLEQSSPDNSPHSGLVSATPGNNQSSVLPADRLQASPTDKKNHPLRPLKSWIDEPGMRIAVSGWAIPGGVLLDESGGHGMIYLTDYFFKKSRLPIPAGAKPVKLWTYRYHKPGTRISGTEHEGSGRDHLIAAGSSDPMERLKAIKGSGVNPEFSAVNGGFELSNFRRNGLQSAGDDPGGEHGGGIEEYIVGRNMVDAGVPALPQDRLMLLPKELQTKEMNQDKPHMLAVQVERVLEDAREAYYGKWPTYEQRVRLASAILFNNIGHGAVNAENLTGDGKIADVGHVTFGYPLTSGLYRCTVCRGAHGNIEEGILPYYFDSNSRGSNFLMALTRQEAGDLIAGMFAHISPKAVSIQLTVEERNAFLAAARDGVRWNREDEDDLRGSLIDAQARLLGLDAKAFDRNVFFPEHMAISLRALMQVAALKRLLGQEAGDKARKKLLSLLDAGSRANAATLLDLFDRGFAQMDAQPEELKLALLREYLPTSEIEHAVYSRMREVGHKGRADVQENFELEAKTLRAIVAQYRKPVAIDPQKFLDVLLSFGADEENAPEFLGVAADALDETKVGLSGRFMEIAPGEFEMGTPQDEDGRFGDEKSHPVELTYRIAAAAGKVTQRQFMLVMGRNPSRFKKKRYSDGDFMRVNGEAMNGDHPVEMVSWYDAIEYCNMLSKAKGLKPAYLITNIRRNPNGSIAGADVTLNGPSIYEVEGFRLPTEAEWERMARAGTQGPYWFDAKEIDQSTWHAGNSGGRTHAVGDPAHSNSWGLNDMAGNTYEWMQDWYGDYESGNKVAKNPTGPTTGDYRVVRGGSWRYVAQRLRAGYRDFNGPAYWWDYVSFRPVRSILGP